MFSSPLVLLGTTIATLLAALFHLATGTQVKQAVLYWFCSVIGFFIGQILGSMFFSSGLMLGQIHIIPAVLLSLLSMVVVRALRI
ncbi:MAG: hypothetical protein ACOX2L_08045 [Anaerolineae bacterium]|jgi:hypothetical protein|nr:hypothetical protein [Chloroflexota bacterium]